MSLAGAVIALATLAYLIYLCKAALRNCTPSVGNCSIFTRRPANDNRAVELQNIGEEAEAPAEKSSTLIPKS